MNRLPLMITQWAFNGPVEIDFGTGPIIRFTAQGTNVDAPATLSNNSGTHDGQIKGSLTGNQVSLELTVKDGSVPSLLIVGDVASDGTASGIATSGQGETDWRAPRGSFTCA